MTQPMSIDTGAPGGDSIGSTVAGAVAAANAWTEANEVATAGTDVSVPGEPQDEYSPNL